MKITEYTFTENEIDLLMNYRDNQKDGRLQLRFVALILLAKGSDIAFISSVVGKHFKTIENWFHQYLVKGIDSLNSFQYKPKQSFLEKEQIDQVVSWVKETNPSKVKEVRQYIKDIFNVSYCNEAVRRILKKKVLRYYALKLFLVNLLARRNKNSLSKIILI